MMVRVRYFVLGLTGTNPSYFAVIEDVVLNEPVTSHNAVPKMLCKTSWSVENWYTSRSKKGFLGFVYRYSPLSKAR